MIRALCCAFAALAGTPALAAECRLALALAMDISSSVDADEDALQRGGLAAALVSPEIRDAFLAPGLPVALAVYEWSGRYNQELLVDWTLIVTEADLAHVAGTVGRSRRSHNEFPTAMGYALAFGAELFRAGPDCLFRTLDIAGDGQNNEGFPPSSAYEDAVFDSVTVNGLVVNAADYQAEVSLVDFYRNEVLLGPGAFLEIAQGFDDYERAMRRKLERELSVQIMGARAPTGTPPG